MDIAPTALALLRQPIPPEMDGRVLTQALRRPEAAVAGAALEWAPAPVRTYSESEAAVVENRLRSLGYLE
jgi:hypothetical protein